MLPKAAQLIADPQVRNRGTIGGSLANNDPSACYPAAVLGAVEAHYGVDAIVVDHTDGLSMEFDDWRFNLRMSNTEPVVRLNVESRADQELMKKKTQELLNFLDGIQ